MVSYKHFTYSETQACVSIQAIQPPDSPGTISFWPSYSINSSVIQNSVLQQGNERSKHLTTACPGPGGDFQPVPDPIAWGGPGKNLQLITKQTWEGAETMHIITEVSLPPWSCSLASPFWAEREVCALFFSCMGAQVHPHPRPLFATNSSQYATPRTSDGLPCHITTLDVCSFLVVGGGVEGDKRGNHVKKNVVKVKNVLTHGTRMQDHLMKPIGHRLKAQTEVIAGQLQLRTTFSSANNCHSWHHQ